MSRLLSAAMVLALATASQAEPQERRETPPRVIAGTGRIAGTVVDSETGGAVRLADVSLTSSAGEFTATTDDAGGFSFDKLPAGSYRLQASKPGFLDTIYGQGRPGTDTPGRRISLKDREEIARLVFPLSRGGSISGTVLDDHGAPVFEATVRVSRWVMRGGRRELDEIRSVQTDERGAFRVGLLPSRQYVVAVSPPEMKAGDDVKAPVGFAPVFYPSATSLANAATIALGIGEHRMDIDLVLSLVKLSKISGMVVDASGNPVPEFPVSLAEQGSGLWTEQGTMTEADGRFTFPRVTPGTYTVTAGERHVSFRKVEFAFHGGHGADIAIKGELVRVLRGVVDWTSSAHRAETVSEEPTAAKRAGGSASEDVSVAGDTNADVILRLSPPRDVTGRVLFEGASNKSTHPIEVALRPPMDFGETYTTTLNSDGTFIVKDVAPGRYFVEVSGLEKPWTFASALSAGVETLDAPLEVPRDRDVLDLTLTFRDRPIELSGAVTDALAQPVTDRRVVVFPIDERLWTTSKDPIQAAMLTEDGRYSFSELRPGTYWIGVVGDVEPDEWLFPEFLRQLMRAAVPITLTEGEKKTQDLRVK